MSLLKNIFVGGSTPVKENGKVLCGDCRTELDSKARRCPTCDAKIFTWRGRITRRTSFIMGMIFLFGEPVVMKAVGVILVLASIYYYLKRPIHYLKPPHRP